MEGGDVVASGGFGCIFNPALHGTNSTNNDTNNDNKIISKLMLEKNAIDEYNNIKHFKTLLNNIPNYSNYFVLDDFRLLKPSKLTKKDMKGFKKCKALKKKGFTQKNINKSLHKLLLVNMPYKGIDISKFVAGYCNQTSFHLLNNQLQDLLTYGIIPMNKKNVYHCDIKDKNVLVEISDNKIEYTRLIDWGLSVYHSTNNYKIPKKLFRRPFQYNVPFSVILFNDEFYTMYDQYREKNNNNNTNHLTTFVSKYIQIWNKIRGKGHMSTIYKICKSFHISKKQTDNYINDYISQILHKYTNKNALMHYFNDVFLHNIDIWGFIMIYATFREKHIINDSKIKYLIIHYLYSNPLDVININDLIYDIKKLK